MTQRFKCLAFKTDQTEQSESLHNTTDKHVCDKNNNYILFTVYSPLEW